MSFVHKLLIVVLPILTLILLPIFILPYHLIKLLLSIRSLICSENLERKVVIITGAATGIGEKLAYEYAGRKAFLSLVDIRNENLGQVADKVRSLGSPDVITFAADVSKIEDCKRFVDETVNYFGQLDHLVNNAGIVKTQRVEDGQDVSALTPVMDINFWGAVYGTQFAVPHLIKSKGKIVAIASGLGWFPVPGLSIYSASKAAVINFFETLRIEIGWAVGITIVGPGLIRTGMGERLISEEVTMGYIPWGTAEEVAKATVKGACRGDMYVTEPWWVNMLFPWKLLFPHLVDASNRLLFRISSNTKKQQRNILQPKAE